MDISDIKYARSGDLNIAYQRFGARAGYGHHSGLICNIELPWEHEVYRRSRSGLARGARGRTQALDPHFRLTAEPSPVLVGPRVWE